MVYGRGNVLIVMDYAVARDRICGGNGYSVCCAVFECALCVSDVCVWSGMIYARWVVMLWWYLCVCGMSVWVCVDCARVFLWHVCE